MSAKYGKLIKMVKGSTHILRIYNNADWDEYVAVVFFYNGTRYGVEVGSHHDTDKDDVIRTGEAMLDQCITNHITTTVKE